MVAGQTAYAQLGFWTRLMLFMLGLDNAIPTPSPFSGEYEQIVTDGEAMGTYAAMTSVPKVCGAPPANTRSLAPPLL